jgi:hypothetical protein
MTSVSHRPRFLDNLNVAYIKSQIETGHASQTKKALQHQWRYPRRGGISDRKR